jgi:small subunit ribosomal protein S3
MGQKVNPNGLRLGINKTWESRWYSKKDYAKNLHEDIAIRKYLRGRLKAGEVSKLEIIRYPDKVNVIVHTARPGIVIGRKGAEVEVISKELQKYTDKNIQIKIKEIKTPELDATLLAQSIARQIEGRVAFRRAMKKTMGLAVQAGVRGVKVACAGRLGGAEMSRSESYKEGMVPLHTFRADVEYGNATAYTTFGTIGVKVWVYKGDIFKKEGRPDAGILVRKRKPAGAA